jgi:integrase
MGVFRKDDAWWIDWYEGGQRRRKKTACRTKSDAKKLLSRIKGKVVERGFGIAETNLSTTELVSRYLAATKATLAESSHQRNRLALKTFFKLISVAKVSGLTPEVCARYAAMRKKEKKSIRTINIETGAIKTCLNWGVRNGLLASSPLSHLRKLKGESPGRLRFLSEDEIDSLLTEAATTLYHDIIFTLIKTGMRRGELVHLQWTDLDFDRRLIRVGGYQNKEEAHHTKTYKERYIPMDDDLEEVLKRQGRVIGCPFVFGTERGTKRLNNLTNRVKDIAKRAKIKDVNLHVLRHTFASHLVMKGVDLPTVQALLGHSTIQMTMRYAHLAPGHLKGAIEKLNFKSKVRPVKKPGKRKKADSA